MVQLLHVLVLRFIDRDHCLWIVLHSEHLYGWNDVLLRCRF
jgi:hypothetical protein